MRIQLLILLAVCSNIQAGPVGHRPARLGNIIHPRVVVNSTEKASQTTSLFSSSSSESLSTPLSTETSLNAASGLRIAKSIDGSQERGIAEESASGHKAAGIAIAPGTATASTSTGTTPTPTTSTLITTSAAHPSEVRSPTSSTSAATIPVQSSTFVDVLNQGTNTFQNAQDRQSTASTGLSTSSRAIQASQEAQSIPTEKQATRTAVATSRLPEVLSKAQPGSGQPTNIEPSPTSSNPGSPAINADTSTSSLAAQSTQKSALLSSSAVAESAFGIFESARSKQATATQVASSVSSTAVQSPSTAHDRESSSHGALIGENSSATSGRLDQAPKSIMSAQLTNTLTNSQSIPSNQASSLTTSSTSASIASLTATSASIVQIPSSLLGDEAPSAMSLSSSSPRQSNSATLPKYAYPDASNGYQAMAQGYNKVFQSLNPLSACDPNDAKQASACVDGQPAKCEVDGTYTLQSCDGGKSCYAVPKRGGQPGLDVACFTPSDANKAIADGGRAALSQESSGKSAPSITSSSPTTTSVASKESLKASSRTSQTPETAPKGTSSTTFNAEQTNVLPAAQADMDGNSGPSATGSTFSTPAATSRSGRQSSVLSTYTSQSSRTKGSSAEHSQQTSSQPEAQQVSSPLPSPTSKAGTGSGVQLSFPGGNEPNSNPEAGGKPQDTKSHASPRDPPPIVQKNVLTTDQQQQSDRSEAAPVPQVQKDVAAARIQSSITPLPTISSTTAGHTPGITVAPIFGASNQNGFITVTITQTTTIHDRG